MAKKIYWIFFFVLGFFIFACDDDKNKSELKPLDKSGLIESVFITNDENNALRVNVNVKFTKDIDFYIRYKEVRDDEIQQTPLIEAVRIVNKTLVLLKANTEYELEVVFPGQSKETVSDKYTFKTGILPAEIQECKLEQNNLTSKLQGYILLMNRDVAGFVCLIDTEGDVVWYELVKGGVQVAKFDTLTNTIYAITGAGDHHYTGTTLLEIDLYGNIVLKKDIKKLYPHHDITKNQNGDYMVVNFVPKVFDLSSIGGYKEHTVFGDGYTILSPDGTIKSTWDCFTELHPLNDFPNVLENNYDEDWIHANSIHYDVEGNYYMTFNNTSEMWKIEGKSGEVLYRVGEHGNVELPAEYYADGLHAARPVGPDEVLALDNGMKAGRNRALVYSIDPSGKKASVKLDIATDSKYYSRFMGNVQFVDGHDMLLFCGTMANSLVFTNLAGKELRVVRTPFLSYRAEYISNITL